MNITALAVLQNGKYALNAVLGEGRLGVTYRGTQTQFGQPVVIKTLKKSLSYHVNFVRLQQQFITRARAIADLQHPSIVPVLDLFEEAGMPYIVMDYVPGQTLADFVKPGQLLPEAKAVHYIRQIAQAVSFVHQKGLVLRNIKPHNIIRCQGTDSVVLISFGISHEFPDGMMQTPTGVLSTGYFPIEPYLPDSAITPATDVYSLAATLYYLLTGHPPISARLGISEAALGDIRHTLPELRKFQPNLSPVVEQAILRGLEIIADKRPQKVEDWLALLPANKEQKVVQSKAINNKEKKVTSVKSVNKSTGIRTPALPVLPRHTSENQQQFINELQENISQIAADPIISNNFPIAESNNYSIAPPQDVPPAKTPKNSRPLKKKKRPPTQKPLKRTDTREYAARSTKGEWAERSRWKLLLITSVITSSLGAGFGLALRYSAPTEPGSTIFHTEQAFPPRQDWSDASSDDSGFTNSKSQTEIKQATAKDNKFITQSVYRKNKNSQFQLEQDADTNASVTKQSNQRKLRKRLRRLNQNNVVDAKEIKQATKKRLRATNSSINKVNFPKK